MKKNLINIAIMAASLTLPHAVYAKNCPPVPEEKAERNLVLATAINNNHYKLSGNYCVPTPKPEDYNICKSAREADSDNNNVVSALEAELYLEDACDSAVKAKRK